MDILEISMTDDDLEQLNELGEYTMLDDSAKFKIKLKKVGVE